MIVGRGRTGTLVPWILKISVKKGCFLSFEWEKSNLTTFCPPRKILDRSHSAPLEKILPTTMYMGFWLRMFAPHICGCKSSCTPGSWWIACNDMLRGCNKGYLNINTKMVIYSTVQSGCYIINIKNTGLSIHINFSIDRQSRHFACPFQATDDTMQMGVRITLYRIYATKKITHVTATAPKMRFVGSKVYFHIV